MQPTEAMIETAARAQWETFSSTAWDGTLEPNRHAERLAAKAALIAAMPLIVAAVAERIADRIEADGERYKRQVALSGGLLLFEDRQHLDGVDAGEEIARSYPEWSKE